MADGGFATDQAPDDAGASMAGDALTIARLAALSDVEYDRCRHAEAAKMGIQVSTLDRQRKAAQRAARPAQNSPEFSDDAVALQHVTAFGSAIRFTEKFGKWHEWDGSRWRLDEMRRCFTLARKTCRAVAQTADAEAAKRLCSATTIAAVEKLARDDERVATSIDDWDPNLMILPTPGGTVDLRSGELRPASPADMATRIAAVAPGGDCPQWRAFLQQVTAGDEDLQSYLQRLAGYCLTGQTIEHVLAFFYGTGSNGKSVFLNTISGILDEYSAIAPMETFAASQSDRHPTELAGLRGARLVISQETDEGKAWAESKLKALTGADKIPARFMHKDYFTYQPQFKILIAGNHKPALRTVDPAIRRRFHLIPFTVTIAPEQRDHDLPEKLRKEWPGILQWAIEGCLEWQRVGLAAPEAVRLATDEYLVAEDSFGEWISERCNLHANLWGQSSLLFKDWSKWASAAGEHPGKQKGFTSTMLARGFKKTKERHGAGFMGLALKPEIDEVEL